MKYVLIQRTGERGDPYWETHKYNWHFKLFGASKFDWITCSYESPEDCKERLKNNLKYKGKYEIIEVFEL